MLEIISFVGVNPTAVEQQVLKWLNENRHTIEIEHEEVYYQTGRNYEKIIRYSKLHH